MNVVLDANVLLRLIDGASSHHGFALASARNYLDAGHTLIVFPQALVEAWVVATRPADPKANGLGLSPMQCEEEINQFLDKFTYKADHPGLFRVWYQLVMQFDCKGKTAHDAKYVASMKTHDLTELMTFYISDFQRYPHITLHDPRVIATGP